MKTEIIQQGQDKLALINSPDLIINDLNSALDFVSTIGFEHECQKIALNKEAIIEDFFDLSTKLAGEVLQKFINYHMKLAIYGDFSKYTSKALKDFMYECNHGHHIFFAANSDEAIAFLQAS